MKTIQAMINCDLPGHRTLEFDTGSGFSSVQISGWRPFREYLAQLSAALPNAWRMGYDESTDRVLLTHGSGSITLRFESQSMADTLGSASTTTAAITGSGDLGSKPYGLTPIGSLHISDPVSGNTPSLRVFRHGRAHSSSYGSAKNYKVGIRLDPSDFPRLQEGPCGVGKVRIGDYSAASAYGSGDLGGYLDGYILSQDDLTLENMEVSLGGSSTFQIVAPNTAHDSAAVVSDQFWGHLDRGCSLNYFCEIEGLPYRLIEKAVGFSSGNFTDSETLIIDDSQKVQYKIDRFKGLAGASGVTLGVLDPKNSLGIFERASVQIPIRVDVNYNDTELWLSKDSTNFGSSGIVYMGKEALTFSGNTGPTGNPSTENKLTGITRNYGPGYDYKKETIDRFRTVTNRKRVWDGCEVDLRAMLLDPYGRAIGATYSDDYQRKIFSGEVEGLPGYDNGVWVIQTRDLIRRLSRKVGFGTSAKTAPAVSQSTASLAGLSLNQFSGLWVRTISTDTLTIKFSATGIGSIVPASIEDSWSVNLRVDLGLPEYHTLGEGIGAIFKYISGTNIAFYTIGDQLNISNILSEYAIDDAGTVFFSYTATQIAAGASYSFDTLSLGVDGAGSPPMWLPHGATLYQKELFGDFAGEVVFGNTNCQGTTIPLVVMKQPPNTTSNLGAFSGSGFAVLDGDNGVNELIKCGAVDSGSIPNRIILVDVTRNLLGQSVNVFKGEREVKEAVRLGDGEKVGALAAQILESSGNTSQRGVFDVLPRGFGYALTAADHVYDNPLTLLDPSATIVGGINFELDTVLTGGVSFVEYFGGLAAAMGMCFSWVRSGTGLRIGLAKTSPSGNVEKYTITDEDMLDGDSGSIQRVAAGPNEVTVTQSENPLLEGKSQYTYRVIEDMLSRGTVPAKVSLYGMEESNFYTFAAGLAASVVNGSGSETAYKLKVKPSRDWLPGQLIRVAVTNPALYDWKSGGPGLNDLARIMEVSRSLTTGECEITIMAGATTYFPTLCPAVQVTGYAIAGSDSIVTVTDSSWFERNDVLRVYNPGAVTADEKVILSVDSGTNEITISGYLAFSPSLASKTMATYPKDDNAAITAKQRSHCHVEDGGSWI